MIHDSGKFGSALILGHVMGEIQALFEGLELKANLLLVVHCQGSIVLVTQTGLVSNLVQCISKAPVWGHVFQGLSPLGTWECR